MPLWLDRLPLAKDVRATLIKHVEGRAITEKDSSTRITTQCATKWDLDKFLKLMLLVWKKMDKIYVSELKSLCVAPTATPYDAVHAHAAPPPTRSTRQVC